MRTRLSLLIGAALAAGFTATPSHAALWSNGTELPGASLTIDGDMADWTAGMLVGSDPEDDFAQLGRDLADFYLANDETYLYGRYTIHGQASTGAQSNRRVYYIMDTDNDRSTGFPYNRFGGNTGTVSDGNEIELRLALANDQAGLGDPAGTGWDQVYVDADADPSTHPTRIDTDLIAMTDTAALPSGREWRISLADLGITGNTTISYYAFQNFDGDMFGGGSWNDASPTFRTYQLVVPEPASLALAAAGGALALLRRSRG